MSSYKFYIRQDGNEYGPYSIDEVRNLGLLDDTEVMESSVGEWYPANYYNFDELYMKEHGYYVGDDGQIHRGAAGSYSGGNNSGGVSSTGNNSNGVTNGGGNNTGRSYTPQESFFDSLFSFSGRSRRSRYWITSFFCSAIMIVLVFLGALLTGGDEGGAAFGYILGIIPCMAISIANGTKRLHDLGHSGWFQLLLFIPIVNIGISVYMAFFEGERHDNQYGSSPY